MCGIVGIVNLHNKLPVNESLIRSMCNTIHHRGPDNEGIYLSGNIGLGVRRLNIIDISGGNQPISNETGLIWIVFNGEIYNFFTLRKELEDRGHSFKTNSDTEVIVHSYEEYGYSCVDHLIGMFAFALWDEKKQHLFIVRDRIGKKPLFYYQNNGKFIFASEIKAIVNGLNIKSDINICALDDYLHYGFIPGPKTIYQSIRKLPPAHWALLQPGGTFTVQRYWDFPRPHIDVHCSLNDYLAELKTLIQDSVRLRLMSDVPLGAFLSGGIDSSVIVSAMSRNNTDTIKTFSIKFAEESYDETRYAQQVATHLGTEHHEQLSSYDLSNRLQDILVQFDEPFADPSAIPTYFLAQFARERVAVALSGDGGDEVFGGYTRYIGWRWVQKYLKLPTLLKRAVYRFFEKVPEPSTYHEKSTIKRIKWLLRTAAYAEQNPFDITVNVFPDKSRRQFLHPDLQASLSQKDSNEMYSFIEQFALNYKDLDQISQMMWTDANTYLVDDLLVKTDRMSMAHSLEVRSPFLDHRLIEFMSRVPVNLKINGSETKYLLKLYAESFLPRSIVYRKKHGFSVPLGAWFLGTLRPLIEGLFFEKQSSSLLDHSSVSKLVRNHFKKKADYSKQIWTLLVLRIWEEFGLKQP